MISILQAEEIHKALIERFGGSHGIRDSGLLSSALQRPFQTFGTVELYPSTLHKAANYTLRRTVSFKKTIKSFYT